MEELDLFANLELTDIFENICSVWQLEQAFQKVKQNKGKPGVDDQTIEDFQNNKAKEIKKLSQDLETFRYKPSPVRRVEIPKEKGKGIRKIGIPTIRDRVLQQSIKMSIEWKYEQKFSESSFGFRPNRSQHQAIKSAQEKIQHGRNWIVDLDLEKFFDTIPRDKLMTKLSNDIKDKRVLKLIGLTLRSGISIRGENIVTTEGAIQGSPLSPLLSNIVLDELDKELEKRNLPFCRFADDANIFCKSRKAATRVMCSITRFIEKHMKLKVNKDKSQVATSDKVTFLGMRITPERISISPKSKTKAKEKIIELTKRRTHQTIEDTIESINQWFRGWSEYFKITGDTETFHRFEAHIRRRLRARLVRQHKRKKYLYRAMLRKGIKKNSELIPGFIEKVELGLCL